MEANIHDSIMYADHFDIATIGLDVWSNQIDDSSDLFKKVFR